MRFPYVFVVGFFLISGVFMNVPISAVPAPKIIEENNREADKKTSKPSKEIADPANKETRENTQTSSADAETQKEKSVQSKEIIDPANEKKESVQNLPAEKPKVPPVSVVDYGKIIEQQLSDFLERDLPKNIAALPLKPIATVAISNLPDGLKRAFFIGDKVYPGFSTLAQLFISGSIGGSDCPGVDPIAPCYVLLFPHASEIVLPLICFKATPESLIVKNLSSEANQNGNWQLIAPTAVTEKAYNIWMAAPKRLFSDFKDFSTVTELFDPTKEHVRNLLFLELDVESLSAFMPLPVLKLVYDAYIKRDFEKIIYTLDVDEKGNQLQMSLRHQVKPQTPWSVFCKTIDEKKKTFRSLNFPSEADTESVFCWDPSASKSLLKSLSTYAKEAEWKRDPIAYQVYRWGQVLYPLLETYLDFEETASVGNCQGYRLGTKWFYLEEANSSITDEVLVRFLSHFIEKCAYQLQTAADAHLWGSNYVGGVGFSEKFLMHKEYGNIHKYDFRFNECAVKDFGIPREYSLFFGFNKGYLLCTNHLEKMQSLLGQMKMLLPFSYCSYSDVVSLSRIWFGRIFGEIPLKLSEEAIETSVNTELAPETFITTVNIPLSLIEAVSSLFWGGTESDRPKNKSEDAKETEKTNKSNVTNEPLNVSEPIRAPAGVQNISDPAIPAQPAAVR